MEGLDLVGMPRWAPVVLLSPDGFTVVLGGYIQADTRMHFFQDLEAHPLLLSLRLRPPYFAVGPLHLLPKSFSDMCVCVCVCARACAHVQ